MQIPWREYVWLVLLLSLAIGLAVEQTRVRRFTAFRDEAARSERTARELADQICTATNTQVEIKDFSDFHFRNRVQSGPKVDIDYVQTTDERVFLMAPAWLGEFDYLALGFLIVVPQFLLTVFLPGSYTNTTRFSRTTFLWYGAVQVLWMTAASMLMFGPIMFIPLVGSKPLTGVICLFSGVVMLARYVSFSELDRDQLEDVLQQTSGNKWSLRALRERLRFQLREFFWLMIAIGLACAVFVEHQQARTLSEHQGRAEWWRKAVAALQLELK